MLVSTTSSRNLFETHQAETKEAEKTKTLNARVILNNEIADVQSNSESLVQTCGILEKEFVECFAEAERKQDIKTMSKANALKRKSKKKKVYFGLYRRKKIIETISRFVSFFH